MQLAAITQGGSPPLPKDSDVKIEIGGAELVAVLTFTGNITPTVAEDARARLMDALCKASASHSTVRCTRLGHGAMSSGSV
ncbi:hypothetical protein CYMTET_21169 [Cymbomonas tetramitiformis]|uniref:Uncharacterized protein n=1 Tax=Cymbomonas tetramitiformis TaxID=36881 RepID=A0AAE0G2M0_9CHLO|nr:hypothetical protein CYMTET_21169 [Cymbomonas tetramitiformis]